jgi:hypothetical protein
MKHVTKNPLRVISAGARRAISDADMEPCRLVEPRHMSPAAREKWFALAQWLNSAHAITRGSLRRIDEYSRLYPRLVALQSREPGKSKSAAGIARLFASWSAQDALADRIMVLRRELREIVERCANRRNASDE